MVFIHMVVTSFTALYCTVLYCTVLYCTVLLCLGEEEESNVMQSNVKLYLFCTENKNWVERGRGLIRLKRLSAKFLLSPIKGHLPSRMVS